MKSRKERIQKILAENGIDGAIVSSPENFHYVTGFASHQHTVSRSPMLSEAVISTKEKDPVFIICMDYEAQTLEKKAEENGLNCQIQPYFTWVGVKQYAEIQTGTLAPYKGEKKNALERLAESVNQLGLAEKTIGIELDFLPVNFYNQLKTLFPKAEFVNVSAHFVYAKSVKSPEEIQMVRRLTEIADISIGYMSEFIKPGVSEKELIDRFREKVMESKFCLPSSWSMLSSGANCAMLTLPTENIVKDGDTIKFDGGVNAEFDFFTTDTSRTWILGNAKKELFEIKDRLCQAQELMLKNIKPGVKICDIFNLGYEYVKEKYPAYVRGHLGHNISMGPGTSELPYLNAQTTRTFEPGMIMCVEVPMYIKDVGGFNIEDMVLITDQGCEVLTHRTPHFKNGNLY